MKDIKQHFKEFLEKEGAYEEFVDKLCEDSDDTFDSHCEVIIKCSLKEELLTSAFLFDSSYWPKLDQKWRNHLKTIEQ